MTRSYAALIPLRGGSKSIPRKNILPLCGRPLCAWAIQAACDCPGIGEVAVSTEDAEIAGIVRGLGLGVRIIERPDELATDSASTESVMLHAIEQLDCDALVTLQATSPLTTASDLSQAIARFEADKLDSLVTGVLQHRFFWTPDGRPLNYEPAQRPRRQDWNGSLIENGAFYITDRTLLREQGCRLGGSIGCHAMSADTLAEIDEPDDWRIVERLLQARSGSDLRGKPIRVVVCDVDGTLTDAGMYYDADGERLKKFNTRDAHGLSLLRQRGIEVWIITGENSPIVQARMDKCGITDVHLGVHDKLPLLERLLAERGIGLDECAYIGDDLNDIACLERVALPACPRDAMPEVRARCRWIAPHDGGSGAVRALCDHLIADGLLAT